jgi:hypothetical protein
MLSNFKLTLLSSLVSLSIAASLPDVKLESNGMRAIEIKREESVERAANTVFDPPITFPTKGAVLNAGQVVTITW